ncbi:MAG: lipid-binding SYLF domain-containing protein [Pseudomonadota bacterium]|nr:lipid-binding SYLF domain-containing protein [Pseudomonadota bacterium]
MSKRFTLIGLLMFVLATIAAPAARAQFASQDVLAHAVQTVNDLKRDRAFGNAQQLIARSRAVMIVPRLYKAGFFFGGSGGEGVLMAKYGPRAWSAPAFFYIASASFGLQIGLQQSEMVLIALTDRGRNALLTNGFKFGATADIAVAMLGSSAEAATTTNAGADIVIWASTAGAYAGLTINGSVVKPSPDHDQSYYGRPVTTREILSNRVRVPVSGARLRADLSTVG